MPPRPRELTAPPEKYIITAADRLAVERGYRWDQGAVDRILWFFPNMLVLSTGEYAGKPFLLEEWQVDMLSRLYGWVGPDGYRRHREVYCETAKKSGKTTLWAGLGIEAMTAEPGAEVINGAVNSKQARIYYREVQKLIRSSPKIRKHFRIREYNGTVTYDRNNARLESLTADADAKEGLNPVLVVLDECAKMGENRRLYNVLKNASILRKQPIHAYLTNAGDENSTLCLELRGRAKRIIDGESLNLSMLPIIYGADKDDDPEDEATWKKANPSLGPGRLLSLDRFREEYEAAKQSPSDLREFLKLRMGFWGHSENPWLEKTRWAELADPEVADINWWVGRNVSVGIDVSEVNDLTSMTLTCLDDDERLAWYSLYFMPRAKARERGRKDGIEYDRWAEEGKILLTDQPRTDLRAICDQLVMIRDLGINITHVAMDFWQTLYFRNLLVAEGFSPEWFQQSYALFNGPCKELERRMLGGDLRHDGNPITEWCIGNVTVASDNSGNIKPVKRYGQVKRVDGVVSGLEAVGFLMFGEFAPALYDAGNA